MHKPGSIVDPSILAAERLVLGTVLVYPSSLVRASLRPGHFVDRRHAELWRAITELQHEGQPVSDPALLTAHLNGRSGDWIGTVMTECISSSGEAANLAFYADVVAQNAREREVRGVFAELASNQWLSADEMVARAGNLVERLKPVPETPVDRIRFSPTEDIFAPLPPTPFLSRELGICPGRPSMLAGYGYSGKTLAGQALLLALASGTPIWGFFPASAPLHCRHLDFEQGKHATYKRYQRLAAGMNLSMGDISPRLETAIFPSVPLNAPDAYSDYCRAAQGWHIVLVDSFAGATPGEVENDSAMRGHVDMLTRVSETTGATFMLIHHAGKPKEGHKSDARTLVRGHSGIFDACGSVLVFVGEKHGPVNVQQVKAPAEAEGRAIDPFFLSISDVPGSVGYPDGVIVSHKPADEQRDEEKAERETADEKRRAARLKRLERATPEKADQIWHALRKAVPGSISTRKDLAALVIGDTDVKEAAISSLLGDGRIRKARHEKVVAFEAV